MDDSTWQPVALQMVEKLVLEDLIPQLGIAIAHIWVLEKGNFVAPLRKILKHRGLQKTCPSLFK